MTPHEYTDADVSEALDAYNETSEPQLSRERIDADLGQGGEPLKDYRGLVTHVHSMQLLSAAHRLEQSGVEIRSSKDDFAGPVSGDWLNLHPFEQSELARRYRWEMYPVGTTSTEWQREGQDYKLYLDGEEVAVPKSSSDHVLTLADVVAYARTLIE